MSGSRTGYARIRHTPTPNNPPSPGVLSDGELAIEQADPMRLWVGVPTTLDASGRRLLYDTSSSSGASVTVSDTAPVGAPDKSLWFDSVGLQLYLKYNDGNSSQFVPTINQPGGIGDAPNDGQSYVRKSLAWAMASAGGAYLPLTGGTLNPGPLLLTTGAGQAARTMTLLGDPTGGIGETSIESGAIALRLGYKSTVGAVRVAVIGDQANSSIDIKAGTVMAIFANGSGPDVDLSIQGRGASGVLLGSVVNFQNKVRVLGAGAGATPSIAANGSDTNIDLLIQAKGTGAVRMTTPTAGDSSTQVATTAFVAPAFNNAGRNLLHNGTFTIQQRGTGSWINLGMTYMADRWVGGMSGTATSTFSIITLVDADRTAIGDDRAQYAMRCVFTGSGADASHYVRFDQRMEAPNRVSNKTVTISFWAKASAVLKFACSLWINSNSSAIPGAFVTLSTQWARYSFTLTFQGNPGYSATVADLIFYYTSGSTWDPAAATIGAQSGTVDLWGMQLELGSVMTPLVRRDPADELRLCQRFYQVWNPPPLRGLAITGAASVSRMGMPLPVQMRAAPAVAVVSPLPVYNGTTVTTITSITNYPSTQTLEFDGVTAASFGATPTGLAVVYLGAGGSMTLSADL